MYLSRYREGLERRATLETQLSDSLNKRMVKWSEVDTKYCQVHFISFYCEQNSIEQLLFSLPGDLLCMVSPDVMVQFDEPGAELVSHLKHVFRVDKFSDLALLLQMQERRLLLPLEEKIFTKILELDAEATEFKSMQQKADELAHDMARYEQLKARFEGDS